MADRDSVVASLIRYLAIPDRSLPISGATIAASGKAVRVGPRFRLRAASWPPLSM
jgi:hypothetical protein